jgi:lysophospholipase L1-like esterase
MSDFLLQDGQTVVFAGDSITDCGRRAAERPYGEGYVRRTIELITARYPERRIRYFNEGIGGNTVQDLKHRWHDDVLIHKPDWVTVKIGINDSHRVLRDPTNAAPIEQFESDYRDILQRTRDGGARVVLIDPFYISTDTTPGSFRAEVLALLPRYLDIVHRLVQEFETLHVPTHDLFMAQLKYRVPDDFCPEPVHPYTSGHLVIAHGLLQTLKW